MRIFRPFLSKWYSKTYPVGTKNPTRHLLLSVQKKNNQQHDDFVKTREQQRQRGEEEEGGRRTTSIITAFFSGVFWTFLGNPHKWRRFIGVVGRDSFSFSFSSSSLCWVDLFGTTHLRLLLKYALLHLMPAHYARYANPGLRPNTYARLLPGSDRKIARELQHLSQTCEGRERLYLFLATTTANAGCSRIQDLPITTKHCQLHVSNLLRGKRVLEIGSFRGNGLRFLFDHLGPTTVVGVDVSRPFTRTAQRLHMSGLGLTYVWADAVRHLPFPDATFDFIFTIALLPDISSPLLAPLILHISRVLAPGGTFAIIDALGHRGPLFFQALLNAKLSIRHAARCHADDIGEIYDRPHAWLKRGPRVLRGIDNAHFFHVIAQKKNDDDYKKER